MPASSVLYIPLVSYTTATVETIRNDFLAIPAKLVRAKGRTLIKLPAAYAHREEFQRASRAVGAFHLPNTFRICPKADRRLRGAEAKNVKKSFFWRMSPLDRRGAKRGQMRI